MQAEREIPEALILVKRYLLDKGEKAMLIADASPASIIQILVNGHTIEVHDVKPTKVIIDSGYPITQPRGSTPCIVDLHDPNSLDRIRLLVGYHERL